MLRFEKCLYWKVFRFLRSIDFEKCLILKIAQMKKMFRL
jgi:hypothetical protein